MSQQLAKTTPESSFLKACYINARSLRNKFEDLQVLAATDNYDIIGVTESWLNTENRDFLAEYKLPGFTILSCERANRIGGGVILYIRSTLNPLSVKTETVANVDQVYIEIKGKSNKVIIGLIYRPPGQHIEVDHALSESIFETSCRGESVIMGDFNLPVAKWGDLYNSHTGSDLYTNLLESDLHQHVHKPTRESNILDLILTTNENLVSKVNVGPIFSTSDHRIITFNIKVEETKVNASKEKVPDYRRANFTRLRSILQNANWNEILNETNIDKAWLVFTTILNNAVTLCVPSRNRRPLTRAKPKWWNNEIKDILSLKKCAFNKYQATQNQADKLELDRIRREAKRLIKRSKKNFEEYIAEASKSNPKEFYQYVKNKKTLNCSIGPLAKECGSNTNNESEMATILTNFFVSVFTDEDCRPVQAQAVERITENLNSIIVTERDVFHAIEKIKVNKTP